MPSPRLPLLALIALLVGGCAAITSRAATPDGTLNADEIRALFSEHTVKSVTFSQGRVSETYYMANGELRQLRNGKLRSGTWRVQKKGRLCLRFGERDESCRAIVRAGNTYVKYVIKKSGNHEPVVRYIGFTPGNPLGL